MGEAFIYTTKNNTRFHNRYRLLIQVLMHPGISKEDDNRRKKEAYE
jgi:hypothetical protein